MMNPLPLVTGSRMFNFFLNKTEPTEDLYFKALKSYKIDPKQNFNKVKSRIGIEAATLYAQLYFSNLSYFKRLKRELELHRQEINLLNSHCDVLIVTPPRMTLQSHLINKLTKQCHALAVTAGFSFVQKAQLNSNNALEGARRLLRIIEEKKRLGRKVIIVSFSFGSAFVRIMLDNLEDKKNIKGWLNMSGLIFGSPRFHCSNKKNIINPLSITLRSFSSEQKYFQPSMDHKGIKVIHLLGLKPYQSLSYSERRLREQLKPWGPNDGLIPYEYYQHLQQPIMALPNQGHLIDLSQMGSTYVNLLSTLVSTLPMQKELTNLKFKMPSLIL
jgi:hypothetical protein